MENETEIEHEYHRTRACQRFGVCSECDPPKDAPKWLRMAWIVSKRRHLTGRNLANALGCNERSARRYLTELEQQGLAAVIRFGGAPNGGRLHTWEIYPVGYE